MKRELLETLFQDGDLLLGKYEEQYYLFNGEQSCQLFDHRYEPCLYIEAAQGNLLQSITLLLWMSYAGQRRRTEP